MTQTIVDYARLELARDPEFHAFGTTLLEKLRALIPDLPADLDASLDAKIRDVCVAKLMLDGYHLQCSEAQWNRAKRLSGR